MGISVKTQKMLWGRAASSCSSCREGLIENKTLVGDICHIVGRRKEGPRGDSKLPMKERDQYDNLILLCKKCHKLADDDPATYTVDKLKAIKEDHEKYINNKLSQEDKEKESDEEHYAWIIDEWSKRARIDEWGWTSQILCNANPRLSKTVDKQLDDLLEWLISINWPHRYKKLEDSFHNFTNILKDFYSEFHKHSNEERDFWKINKFYKEYENQELRHRKAIEYDKHVTLVKELLVELTRAANYICEIVRKHILPSYRLQEGALLVIRGPTENLEFVTIRYEYARNKKTSHLYPGLVTFKESLFENR